MGWRWHDGDGGRGLGDIPDLAGRGGGGGEGAHCATRRVVQSRCHTEEVEPGRFVRKCEKTERLLRDCVGRDAFLCLRRVRVTRRMSMKVEGLVLHGDALHGEKEFRRALIIPPGVEFGHIIHDFDMDGEEENPSPASEDPPYSL